ncbi:hypothetical protein ACTXT7_011298 [Hymenolepis weldensis]
MLGTFGDFHMGSIPVTLRDLAVQSRLFSFISLYGSELTTFLPPNFIVHARPRCQEFDKTATIFSAYYWTCVTQTVKPVSSSLLVIKIR